MEHENKEIVQGADKPQEKEPNTATAVMQIIVNIAKLTIGGLLILLALAIGALVYNDAQWRKTFNSYDYISQDGSGYNNYNTGTQGDVNNGAESTEIEGQE